MKQTIIVIGALVFGFVGGGLLWSSAEKPTSGQASTSHTPLTELSGQLQSLENNADLPAELITLLASFAHFLDTQKSQNIKITETLNALKETVDGMSIAQINTLLEDATTVELIASSVSVNTTPNRLQDQQQRLTEVGFSDGDAQAIVAAVDEATLARLDLRYQAAREGWSGAQLREAAAEIPNTREFVRKEFGEAAYDRYLYATGQPNRVQVQSTLSGSVAEQIGLLPGDTILALDNKRVYDTGDLIRIASSGESGESVPLTYKRGTQTIDVYIPRGPIGFNGGRAYDDPDD